MNSTIASNVNGGSVINKQAGNFAGSKNFSSFVHLSGNSRLPVYPCRAVKLALSVLFGERPHCTVANGSYSSLLMSSIEFSLTEIKTNFSPPSNQGKYLIKLVGKDDVFNGQNNKNWDQNKNPIENSAPTINGNRENNAAEDSIPVPKVQLYTGKIHVEWNQVSKIGAGLNNLGNTCFMNTVIQCLTYCPPLANYLLHDNDHSSKCTITGFCMMCLLQRHMKRATGKTGEVIKPLDVYQRLKLIAKHFQFGRQEDAHEFLRYVIDHLWKACLLQTNGVNKLDSASKETTVINKIFGGYHRSQVICMRCKKQSNTFDHFMDFILDIKQNVMSLEKALEKFTQPELLQQENCYKCPKCKMKVEAQKRFSVYQAPTVATFQLKRFDYNRTFGGKITKQVAYPEKLNLRPYMSEPKGNPVWYRLNAVLVHSGPSCNSGHYYCYVKNSNGFWYIMDDQRVHQVSLNQVLNQSAYVLFYIQTEFGERPPLKKCLDNKSSYIKGAISNNHFPKVPEISNMKPAPLKEKSPFATSNNQVFSAPKPVKKFNITTPNREKVSFGFRPGLSPMAFNPLKNKNTMCAPHGGLVPYVEDSSESSDASESNHSAIKSISEVKHKNSSFERSPRLEIKAKLSKSVFNSAIPKVGVSSNWIVTPEASEMASSCSSMCGVNSTANWQVTAMEDVESSPKVTQNKDFEAKEFSDSMRSSIVKPPKYSLKYIEEGEQSNTSNLNGFENGLPTKKCNFRKQQYKFKSHFHESEGAGQNSFKRKSCDSYSKAPKDSPHSEHDENRYNPLPKKVKYSEKSPFLTLENNMKNCNEILEIPNNSVGSGVLQPRQQQSVSNGDSHPRTSVTNNSSSTSNDSGLSHYHRDLSLSHLPENQNMEDSPRRDCTLTKGKHKEKECFPDSSQNNSRKLVSNKVKNQSLYGTEVPTWRGDDHYRPSTVPFHEHRRYFDAYDEEFDRGKVRKSKMKNYYRNLPRKNPFQKHADRYNHKYNGGKFYNNHRKYNHDSHYNWKPKQKDSYHNRYNRSHHQRHHY